MAAAVDEDHETWTRIARDDPTLTDLFVGGRHLPGPRHAARFSPGDAADLAALCRVVGRNAHLKRVHLVGDHILGDARGAVYDGFRENASIDDVYLVRCNLSQGAVYALLNALAKRGKLRKISLAHCTLGKRGAKALAAAMGGCSCLRFISSDIDSQTLGAFSTSTHRQLDLLDLSCNNIDREGCRALVTLLQDPLSSLRILALDRNGIDDECAVVLANALRGNTKLTELHLDGNRDITEHGWNAFSRVLCNTASVNDTFHSNHSLEMLEEFECNVTESSELCSLLELNGSTRNKREVAVRKVLRYHRHLSMDPFLRWELKVLPIAVRWLDGARTFDKSEDANIDSRILSTIYQFAQAMPMHVAIVPSPSKGAPVPKNSAQGKGAIVESAIRHRVAHK